jgi:hypothetical protein
MFFPPKSQFISRWLLPPPAVVPLPLGGRLFGTDNKIREYVATKLFVKK